MLSYNAGGEGIKAGRDLELGATYRIGAGAYRFQMPAYGSAGAGTGSGGHESGTRATVSVRDDDEKVQRRRGNAGLWLDSPWPECYILCSVRLGRFPGLLTEQGACPVHGEPEQ